MTTLLTISVILLGTKGVLFDLDQFDRPTWPFRTRRWPLRPSNRLRALAAGTVARIPLATGTARLPDRFDFCRVLRGVWTITVIAPPASALARHITVDLCQCLHSASRPKTIHALTALRTPSRSERRGRVVLRNSTVPHWSRRDPSLDSSRM